MIAAMTVPYQQIVHDLRQAFPQPVSDRVHDAYFVFSFLRALDRVDSMKSRAPLLGRPEDLVVNPSTTRAIPAARPYTEICRQIDEARSRASQLPAPCAPALTFLGARTMIGCPVEHERDPNRFR